MLVNPQHGWVTVEIGDWSDRASYLTDVPIDILEGLIKLYTEHEPVAIRFDAEGWDYIVVIDHYKTYIIDYTYRTDDEYLNSEDEKQVLTTVEINKDNLAKEFLSDIERDYDKWAHWMYYDEEDMIAERKERLDTKLLELKSLIKN